MGSEKSVHKNASNTAPCRVSVTDPRDGLAHPATRITRGRAPHCKSGERSKLEVRFLLNVHRFRTFPDIKLGTVCRSHLLLELRLKQSWPSAAPEFLLARAGHCPCTGFSSAADPALPAAALTGATDTIAAYVLSGLFRRCWGHHQGGFRLFSWTGTRSSEGPALGWPLTLHFAEPTSNSGGPNLPASLGHVGRIVSGRT